MAKPAKCISESEARQLQQNWIDTRAKDIKKDMGEEDARQVFYTVAELEEYLAYVKTESTKQGISTPGIRIYFAAYNDDKSKKATVFLAPTKGDTTASDNNYNIEALNRGNHGWPPNNY
jgi:excinuclease UvrABC nuclease subunit